MILLLVLLLLEMQTVALYGDWRSKGAESGILVRSKFFFLFIRRGEGNVVFTAGLVTLYRPAQGRGAAA